MSKKIAFIGAGSLGFTRGLVRDILTFEAFKDATIALMDIDKERLAFSKKAVEKIIKAGKYPAKVIATTDRAAALKGADGVLITILQGGPQVFRTDIEIPKKYNVDINVGDTRGPSGIFRTLRTLPVMLDICKDIRKHCPDAIVLNYTNPMAMLCRGMQSEFPELNITGLCHSVQGTAEMLARWIGAPMEEITYLCAGINHQAFYLDYKWKGKDAYPLIRKAILKKPEIYNAEHVRNEMYLALDYYVTESSGHNSEYNAWVLEDRLPVNAHIEGVRRVVEQNAARLLSKPLEGVDVAGIPIDVGREDRGRLVGHGGARRRRVEVERAWVDVCEDRDAVLPEHRGGRRGERHRRRDDLALHVERAERDVERERSVGDDREVRRGQACAQRALELGREGAVVGQHADVPRALQVPDDLVERRHERFADRDHGCRLARLLARFVDALIVIARPPCAAGTYRMPSFGSARRGRAGPPRR